VKNPTIEIDGFAIVNEGSTGVLSFQVWDYTNTLIEPSNLRYKVSDSDKKVLKDWTAITILPDTLSGPFIIELSHDLNIIGPSVSTSDERIVTVEATYSTDGIVVEEYYYEVVNLLGIDEDS
jgi:hypothetical protein